MRIERIKVYQIRGLEDIDLIIPSGPKFLLRLEGSQQAILVKLLLELLYSPIATESSNQFVCKGFLEVWVNKDGHRYYIHRDFVLQGNDYIPSLIKVSEETTRQQIIIPDSMTIGDYIFGINQKSFLQSIFINWPETNELEHLKQRIDNLRQSGDEELSPIKALASLLGAQMKVNEQGERMSLVKAEYNALRKEWTDSCHWQDEERLLQIEITKLRENEAIISEKIERSVLIQERLTLLNRNQDYRKLRKLHTEILNLNDHIHASESNLQDLSKVSPLDWPQINTVREDCIEWARLQKKVDRLVKIEQKLTDHIARLQDTIKISGFEGSNDENERLQRILEDKSTAEEELAKLTTINTDFARITQLYSQELTNLQKFGDMENLTKEDALKITRWEKRLRNWKGLKIGHSLDNILQNYLKGISVEEKLSSRLQHYYQRFHVPDFEGYSTKVSEFHSQKENIENIQRQIDELKTHLERAKILQERVNAYDTLLKQAFISAKVEDFPAWLKCWEDSQRKKTNLSIMKGKQKMLKERLKTEEQKLHGYIVQLQEKLANWNIVTTEREEVLAALFKVATELQLKDQLQEQLAGYSQQFKALLGTRGFETLSHKLEPLAELDQEARISNDDRTTHLNHWDREREEIRRMRMDAEQRLKASPKYPSLAILEEKIDSLKHELISYEELQRAINDTRALLETAIKDWQTKFGNLLSYEMKRVLKKFVSDGNQEIINTDKYNIKCEYFSYRMAIAQLLIGINRDIPLFFSVSSMDSEERLWIAVINYLTELSTRQIILITSNFKIGEKLKSEGWPTDFFSSIH
jgi:DNA repair protein SbcC/Rad50